MSTGKELPPVPIFNPLLGAGGLITKVWADFFGQLRYRGGGSVALTNLQLASGGSGPSVVGSRGAPTLVTAAGGLPYAAAGQTINFISGNAGAVTVTANPQIQAGTAAGQQLLTIVGCNDTNTVEFQNGTGLQLAGAVILGLTTGVTAGGLSRNSSLSLFWDGTQWVEWART